MKKLKWIGLAVIVVIVLVVAGVWMNLNGIVRRTVESQASSSLDLKTTLGSANVSLLGGSLGLNKLQIASPPGYKAPDMISLDHAGVQVSLSQLRSEPIHIGQIVIDGPQFVIESNGTKLNFQSVLDQTSKAPTDEKSGEPKEPIKLIIDELSVTGAKVSFRPGMSVPGMKEEYALTLPSIMMKNIGQGEGAQNGAAIKDIVAQLLATVAERAAESDQLPPELKQLLSLSSKDVKAQVGKAIEERLDKAGGGAGKAIGDAMKGDGDGSKPLEKAASDMLGGRKKKNSTTKP